MEFSLFPPIPYDTARAALAVFGNSNMYLVIGDQVDALFEGLDLRGSHALTQAQQYRSAVLYLCTVFQHLESMPDQLAVEALRKRVDWKYAIHLPLNETGMDMHLLCAFRQMAAADPAARQNFQRLLARLVNLRQIALCGCLKHDASQVLYRVCTISRVASIWEAMNNTLQALVITNTEWIREHSLPNWYERYGREQKKLRLSAGLPELEAFAQAVGRDGSYLLQAVSAAGLPELDQQPELIALRRIWEDQFAISANAVIWRKGACAGCSIASHLRAALWNSGQPEKEGGL